MTEKANRRTIIGNSNRLIAYTWSSFFRFSSLGFSRVSSRSRAYFFSLAWLHSCPAINSRESGWPRPPAYLCLLSPFLSRTWGSRVRVEKTTTRTASLLHASYSQRKAAVPRFDAPTWPNWKKPVSSSRSSFFACILAFCTARVPRLLSDALSLLLVPFATVIPLSSLSLSLSFSFFISLPPSYSQLILSNSLERVDAAWANPWGTLWSAVTRFISLSRGCMLGAVCLHAALSLPIPIPYFLVPLRVSACICQGRRFSTPRQDLHLDRNT